MKSWWSIEVIADRAATGLWALTHADVLTEAALLEQATDWSWHDHAWGTVLEVELPDDAAWERFLANPAVRAALDAVPDPLHGLIVYRGRGGSAGIVEPRRPRPLAGAGAVALPLPIELLDWADIVRPRVLALR